MKFGSRVVVTRGCSTCIGPHCAMNKRDVPGRLIAKQAGLCLVKLDWLDGVHDHLYRNGEVWFGKSRVKLENSLVTTHSAR